MSTGSRTRNVLVIDDEKPILRLMDQALGRMGFTVSTADSAESGLQTYASGNFDLVLTDVRMAGADGFEVLERVRSQQTDAIVIVMTAFASIESAVRAIKAGASDYLAKPLDLEHLEIVVTRALETRNRRDELAVLRDQLLHQGTFEGMVGVTEPMRRVYDLVGRVAGSDVTVLVQGETGTGKERVARAIHNRSGRKGSVFMPIHCGALPENLLESELFGHERGAFTGAVRRKLGLLEQAAGGTLFLDEIESMSPALQVKLLRAIQEREVQRVGGDLPISVDFRLVAASLGDLRQLVDDGVIRADLYYRLSGFVVELPPLRERLDDIPLLSRFFADLYGRREGKPTLELTPEALMVLRAHQWPGNVRELEHAIEQAVLMANDGFVNPEDLPPYLNVSPGAGSAETTIRSAPELVDLPLREARERFERQYMVDLLERVRGNVAEAAKLAGIHRRHFYAKLKRYAIKR